MFVKKVLVVGNRCSAFASDNPKSTVRSDLISVLLGNELYRHNSKGRCYRVRSIMDSQQVFVICYIYNELCFVYIYFINISHGDLDDV